MTVDILSRRYAYIDSLRALAAFSVIYYHSALNYTLGSAEAGPMDYTIFYISTIIFDLGKIGVIVFFAISGFVVPFSLLRSRERPITSFAISRIFRLYPAYWVSIIAAVFIIKPQFDIATLFANILMIQQFIGIDNIQGLYWTLQIELIFYVLCAFFFYLGFLKGSRSVFIIALAHLVFALTLAAARFYLDKRLPVALPLSLSIMFWGILWRRQILEEEPEATRFSRLFLFAFSALIFPISYFGYRLNQDNSFEWARYVLTYYSALTIFIVFTKYIHINIGLIAYCGALSYSIYLFGSVAREIIAYYFGLTLFGSPQLQILLSCGLATLIAYVVYNLVEAPAIRLGHRLSMNRQDASRRIPGIDPST